MTTSTLTSEEIKLSEKINLNDLSLKEKIQLTENTYQGKSYFQTLFQNDSVEKPCQTVALALRNEITRILLEKNLIKTEIALENLHQVLSDEMKTYNFNDGVNKISTYFYDTDNQFLQTYYQFIKLIRDNYIKEPFWFQATPTLRLHCPNAINSHHYPRYHSDISYGHPPEEINIWVPFTELLDGHSFRIMSVENSKKILVPYNFDFSPFIQSAIHDKEFTNQCETLSNPVQTQFGNMFLFDSRCVHSGEPMKTHSRVSMDIRILPISQYEKMSIEYQGSGRLKILFKPGHCYHQKNSDQF